MDFLSSIVDSALRYRMKDCALDRTYKLDQIEDAVSSARYYVPQGKPFSNGQWVDLTGEQKMLLYSMGLTENERQKRLGLKPRRGRKPKVADEL